MVHHAHAVSPEDRHQRVDRVVRLYADKIKAAVTDEAQADVWFVVVPDEVYASCRPESVIPKDVRKPFETSLGKGIAKKLVAARSFFEELNDDATPYKYQPHFHNQLKALWLEDEVPMQVIRESTIAPNDFLNPMGYPKRKIGLASKIAWNLCTAAFYKSGARPWKLAEVRSGVCYLGIVFKLDESVLMDAGRRAVRSSPHAPDGGHAARSAVSRTLAQKS